MPSSGYAAPAGGGLAFPVFAVSSPLARGKYGRNEIPSAAHSLQALRVSGSR